MPLIRARDLRVIIKEMGFEKGVVHALEIALNSRQRCTDIMCMMSRVGVTRCMDELGKLIAIGGQMKQTVDQLHRDIKGNVDGEQS